MIRRFLDALGVPEHRIPTSADAQADLYRSLLAERRVLIVLDNARDPDQVRPLLTGAPGCLTIVTSRDPLTGLIAVDGAHPLMLDLVTVDEARQKGFVETLFGRRRYIPELRDRNFSIRSFGERTATNSPLQGSAADLIKIAMIRIHAALKQANLRTKMLLQVHDELVFETPEHERSDAAALVKREMEGVADLRVPLVVTIGAGKNWIDAKG